MVNAMPIPSMYLVYYIYLHLVVFHGKIFWYMKANIPYMDCVWDDNAINACSHPESQTCSPALEPT